MANCELCGGPMPDGEQMFKYHGFSGPCPEMRPGTRPVDPPSEMCGHDGCCEAAVYIPQLNVPLVGIPRSAYVLKGQLSVLTCAKHFADLKAEDLMMDETREVWEMMNRASASASGVAPAPLAWNQRFLSPVRLDSEEYKSFARLARKKV